jgi:hypothetical protein
LLLHFILYQFLVSSCWLHRRPKIGHYLSSLLPCPRYLSPLLPGLGLLPFLIGSLVLSLIPHMIVTPFSFVQSRFYIAWLALISLPIFHMQLIHCHDDGGSTFEMSVDFNKTTECYIVESWTRNTGWLGWMDPLEVCNGASSVNNTGIMQLGYLLQGNRLK